ncbi:MAG TPA: hypothetical protein VFP43_23775 [Mesorhizobium sp.]|nr:hypothetical protein [Mesorhizobium sp.]
MANQQNRNRVSPGDPRRQDKRDDPKRPREHPEQRFPGWSEQEDPNRRRIDDPDRKDHDRPDDDREDDRT